MSPRNDADDDRLPLDEALFRWELDPEEVEVVNPDDTCDECGDEVRGHDTIDVGAAGDFRRLCGGGLVRIRSREDER